MPFSNFYFTMQITISCSMDLELPAGYLINKIKKKVYKYHKQDFIVIHVTAIVVGIFNGSGEYGF